MKTANIQLEHNEFQREPIKFPLCILANDIDVPMNIGSIFRIADALGVQKIFLTGSSPVPPNNKIKKTSRSTEKAVEYEYKENALEVVDRLKQSGYLIVSIEITASSIDIRNFTTKKNDKTCLIVGAENAGVSQDLLDVSDYTIHIPMFGQNSSMNVATACAIAVFEFARKIMP
ncbi:MAG: TrmH family RNA methyltransferase [Thermodesulfobacteriota bacterium]|nr:MAG: TrmH family RNA methyltransferase [Thermodesulfobacteriota bacterium]